MAIKKILSNFTILLLNNLALIVFLEFFGKVGKVVK